MLLWSIGTNNKIYLSFPFYALQFYFNFLKNGFMHYNFFQRKKIIICRIGAFFELTCLLVPYAANIRIQTLSLSKRS